MSKGSGSVSKTVGPMMDVDGANILLLVSQGLLEIYICGVFFYQF